MENIIKTLYTAFYQETIEVSYSEQVIVTLSTVVLIAAIIIPLIHIVALMY